MTRLGRINSPEDLRALGSDELVGIAHEIRDLITRVVETNGGHLASSLGAVDLTVALHRVFDFTRDRLVFDVSHQAYAHKILTGRRDRFTSLRQRHGLAGYTHPRESPFDLFHFAHAGTATSLALGLGVGDPQVEGRRHVAVVGDASVATGITLEALNHAGVAGRDLLVLLNDNAMSIAPSVGALDLHLARLRRRHDGEPSDPAPDFFTALGAHYEGPVDGHDLPALVEALQSVHDRRGVTLLHVLTRKGEGHPEARTDPVRFHGVSPKVPPRSAPGKEFVDQGEVSWSRGFAEALIERGRRDADLHVITAAMPDNTGVSPFRARFPERAHDVGIAEPHAVAFAAGLAKAGRHPVCAIFSTFLQRAYDQLMQEIALNEMPVLFCLDRAGIVGPDGATHNGCFDIAYLRSLPGIVLMAPRDLRELAAMIDLALDSGRPAAIRYPRAAAPARSAEIPASRPLALGTCDPLRHGRDACVLAYGSMVHPALEAAERLEEEGVSLTVIDARFARPLDMEAIMEYGRGYPDLFLVEEHSIRGGFGSAVLEEIALHGGVPARVHPLALPDRFIPHGTRSELLRELGCDPAGLVRRIRERLPRGARSI